MSAQPAVLVVGDGIIDRIRRLDGEMLVTPGGAALNVAVGVRVLGQPSALVFTGADDESGSAIRDHLAAHGVDFLIVPSAHGTGIASATPTGSDGALSYTFNHAIRARHYAFDSAMRELAERARVIALTGFPLDDPDSVERYLKLIEDTGAVKVIDPNPRPAAIHDLGGFRAGFLRIASRSDLVKVSDEDLELLFGESDGLPDALAGKGSVVLVTHGAGGITVHLPDGRALHRPIAPRDTPILDTLGAGDATLASVLTDLVTRDSLASDDEWNDALARAMEVAAETCRAPGGLLRPPAGLVAARWIGTDRPLHQSRQGAEE